MPDLTRFPIEGLVELRDAIAAGVDRFDASEFHASYVAHARSRLVELDAELDRRRSAKAKAPAKPAAQPSPAQVARVIVAPAPPPPPPPPSEAEAFAEIGRRAYERRNNAAAETCERKPARAAAPKAEDVFSDQVVAGVYARMNARTRGDHDDELADRLTPTSPRHT